MNRTLLIIAAASLAAFTLGLALAYPLIFSDMPSFVKTDFKVDIAYAYMGAPVTNANVTGIGKNMSNPREANDIIFPYLVIFRVTNPSDEWIRISMVGAIIGPNVNMENKTGPVSATNPIINTFTAYNEAWGQVKDVGPHETDLVAISGMNGVPDFFYNALNNSKISIFGQVDAKTLWKNNAQGSETAYEQVQFQNTGDGYLYNALLKDDQTLLYAAGGLEITVVPRN